MRKTKIVCTIGPATKEVETLKELILAGMNVARINFSHGNYENQKVYIDAVKKAREELNMPVALLLDTQGPEIRTGKLEQMPVELKINDIITLVNEDIIGTKEKVSISYKNLYKDIKIGTQILIDDGKIELKVIQIKDKDIVCKVLNGGMLGNCKSINLPGTHVSLPSLKEKDIQDLKDGCKADFDFIAASFVRSAQDIKDIRKVLDENGGERIKIISKIESQEGIDNFDEILELSDGIMVARGDLGVEIPLEEVPIMQKKFIQKCNDAGKSVITATQMLESMTESKTPTRAEVSDVANAIFDVTGAIMLSGESAMGKNPVECVNVMNRIAKSVEEYIKYWKRFTKREHNLKEVDYEFNLCHSVTSTAMEMNAKAIFAYTETGNTPRMVASFLPNCPIYALTHNEKTYRQLSLNWNTTPILVKNKIKPNDVITSGIEEAKKRNYVKEGDIVVIAGGASIVSSKDIEEDSMNRTIGGVLKI
ncbi:MAG: pyruvate kinase [Clostridiaceae bacterium]|nr:pyruvate kinase [Clostridiaceae bacterium]